MADNVYNAGRPRLAEAELFDLPEKRGPFLVERQPGLSRLYIATDRPA